MNFTAFSHIINIEKNSASRKETGLYGEYFTSVVMDIEDYERDRAEKKLLMKLQEAEEAVKDGEGWLSLDELKALVGE